jgi:thiamine pyrophosphate-dependent acetolactate synthase large subunit-like protein
VLHVARSGGGDPAYTPAVHVAGAVAHVLEELAPRVRSRSRADWDVAELDRAKRGAPALWPRRGGPASGSAPPGARTVALARELTPSGTIAAFERRWLDAASAWSCVTPGDLLHPGLPGLAGWAVPAALAAALARRTAPVLAFVDAGGLAAALAELDTARRLQTPLAIIVLGEAEPRLLGLVHGLGVPVVAGPAATVLPGGLAGLPGRGGPLVVHASETAPSPV